MTHPIFSLRTALHQKFMSDAVLSGLLGGDRYFDSVPPGIQPPYILFGEASLEDWSALEMKGYLLKSTLEIWSREGGDAEVLSIAQQVESILLQQTLTIPGFRVVTTTIRAQQIDKITAEGLHHVRMDLDIHVEADTTTTANSR